MKKIALAAALSVSASTAFAGNMEAPVMEAPIIVEEAAAGSSARHRRSFVDLGGCCCCSFHVN